MLGSLSSIDPMYVAAEGVVLLRLCNMSLSKALAVLVGAYYVLNMEYPAWARNFFIFLEAILLNNTQEAKKRVAINKFFKELK